MNTWEVLCAVGAILAILLSVTGILLSRHRTRSTMEQLNHMLQSAMDGTFFAHRFDESMLSAVEVKLSQYLSSCILSHQNLTEERNQLRTLISDLSHQTKTPLSNISLYAQLLAEQNLTERGQNCVTALMAQTEKLSFLIDSLLKLSRLETGILSLSPKWCTVQDLLDGVVTQISPKAEEKGISVVMHPTEAMACFDTKWTVEALYNVVDNAVKYTSPDGTVTISVTAYELFCRIDLSDTGIGISEEEQSKIFARFYRSPAVSKQEGVGIGLYLSRVILAEEGGYLKVKSSLGVGTTFSVFLPADETTRNTIAQP